MRSNRQSVLLTNAEERSMLAAARSLDRAGYEVSGASSSRLAATKWSRSCSNRMLISDPREDADLFLEQLCAELSAREHAVLIAGSDSALLAISRGRERLEKLTSIGLPPGEIVERCQDREALAQAATAAGLPAARSIRCTGEREAARAARELGFPVVLKSTSTAFASAHLVASVPKGAVVENEAQLLRDVRSFDGPLLLQRHVGGELISFGGVFAGGRLLGTAISRYARTWPVAGGSVSFSETIPSPTGLCESVARLLDQIGWEGIFELELIDSPEDGLVPIDLNPRPYGSMALAVAAGAPLAVIWCEWLLGQDPQPRVARAGCRYRWEDGELRHIAWQTAHGRLPAALRALRPHRAVTHASFALDDPLPLLAQGAYLARKASGHMPGIGRGAMRQRHQR